MFWSLLTIAIGVYAGLSLVFLIFQRSFIYMPTPVTPAHAQAFTLEVQAAQVRISSRPHDGPKALVYFGGNAEDVASTVPELTELFHDRAIYGMHYRGYSGSSGRPAETALRSDARSLFKLVHGRHPDVIVVGRSLGSSLAVQLAAEEPVTRLVLITPFESILSIAQRVAPFLPMPLLLRDRYESWRYAPKVACPTLVIAASHDEIVPLAARSGSSQPSHPTWRRYGSATAPTTTLCLLRRRGPKSRGAWFSSGWRRRPTARSMISGGNRRKPAGMNGRE